jgi:DNA-binding response OmpR family regulator
VSDDPIRVLVLDDDELHLELIERVLAHDGFSVRRADTVAAMESEARGFDPHVVLVDMNLPDTSREQVVASARASAPAAKIMLCSAWEESRLRTLCKELGADGYVSKGDSVMAIGQRLSEMRAILARR